jgi:hypothetical protein
MYLNIMCLSNFRYRNMLEKLRIHTTWSYSDPMMEKTFKMQLHTWIIPRSHNIPFDNSCGVLVDCSIRKGPYVFLSGATI